MSDFDALDEIADQLRAPISRSNRGHGKTAATRAKITRFWNQKRHNRRRRTPFKTALASYQSWAERRPVVISLPKVTGLD